MLLARTLACLAISAVVIGLTTPAAFAQAPSKSSAPLRFDVASIKPNSDGDYRVYVKDTLGGRFSATGITLRLLMRYAYDVQDLQITGGPRWIGTDRWDIEAKAEGVSTMLLGEQISLRMQALLADRFQVKVHFEKKKQMPAYALVIGKSGIKLRDDAGEQGPDTRVERGHMSFQKVRMDALTSQLTRQLGRQVLDKTNLTGEYDFTLDWTPEPGENGAIPGQQAPPPSGDAVSDQGGPSIFTALQEQLGLRLEPMRAPLDVLVIDRVEKPSAN